MLLHHKAGRWDEFVEMKFCECTLNALNLIFGCSVMISEGRGT